MPVGMIVIVILRMPVVSVPVRSVVRSVVDDYAGRRGRDGRIDNFGGTASE